MGVAVGQVCFSDAATAASAVYSVTSPRLTDSGALRLLELVSGAWQVNTYEAGVLVDSWGAPTVALPVCDPGEAVADGVTLGFLAVLVLSAGFAVRWWQRSLNL